MPNEERKRDEIPAAGLLGRRAGGRPGRAGPCRHRRQGELPLAGRPPGARHVGHRRPGGPPRRARSVRVREGRTLVTDGPFAETKEVVGGFDIIDCGSLDEAVEIAAAHPIAQMGRSRCGRSGGTDPVAALQGCSAPILNRHILKPPGPLGSGGSGSLPTAHTRESAAWASSPAESSSPWRHERSSPSHPAAPAPDRRADPAASPVPLGLRARRLRTRRESRGREFT